MKKIFFTPGPSQTHQLLGMFMREALHRDIPSLSHRSEEFMSIMKDLDGGLRKLLCIPSSHHIFFLSSSLESMERIIDNVVTKASFHFTNGNFGDEFLAAATAKGKKTYVHRFNPQERCDMDKVQIPKGVELVCITQNETSNGSTIPLEDIYRLKKRFPLVPLALDIVSSAPYSNVDYSKIDCAFFSVQKGFGLPAGLGVLIVSDALAAGSKMQGYHDFPSLLAKSKKFQTPETPNVLNLFLLSKVVQDYLAKGVQRIRKETEEKAVILESGGNAFIKNASVRSRTVIVLETGNRTKAIMAHLKAQGIIVGKGYGLYKESQIRIANFPQHTAAQVRRLVREMRRVF